MNRVFVYGTLKLGQRNDHFLREAKYVGRFTTEACYSMYEFGGYPAVCLDGRHAIEGEVYHVDNGQFGELDDLEWYPRFYQRIEISTRYGQAWMYIVQPELCRGKELLAGRWP